MKKLLSTILAVYAVSHIIVFEHGPSDILKKFRHFAGVRYDNVGQRYGISTFGDLLNCQICTSTWLAFPISWICKKSDFIANALAAIGVICLFEDLSQQ